MTVEGVPIALIWIIPCGAVDAKNEQKTTSSKQCTMYARAVETRKTQKQKTYLQVHTFENTTIIVANVLVEWMLT